MQEDAKQKLQSIIDKRSSTISKFTPANAKEFAKLNDILCKDSLEELHSFLLNEQKELRQALRLDLQGKRQATENDISETKKTTERIISKIKPLKSAIDELRLQGNEKESSPVIVSHINTEERHAAIKKLIEEDQESLKSKFNPSYKEKLENIKDTWNKIESVYSQCEKFQQRCSETETSKRPSMANIKQLLEPLDLLGALHSDELTNET
jgi:hypothetical protein